MKSCKTTVTFTCDMPECKNEISKSSEELPRGWSKFIYSHHMSTAAIYLCEDHTKTIKKHVGK